MPSKSKERRVSPRKRCRVPLRFRVLNNGHVPHAPDAVPSRAYATADVIALPRTWEGEIQNLSERGIYFTSREQVSVGEALEMYLTLPTELTGRPPEPVRCSARVVHAEPCANQPGVTGVGAVVERFAPFIEARDWNWCN